MLAADLTLSSSQFSPFSPQLARDLKQDPDFSVVSPFRQAETKVRTSDTFVVGVDPSTITQVANIEMDTGTIADLAQPGTVIVSRTEADSKGFSVGDTIQMRFPATGTQNLRVVDASVFPRIPGYYPMLPIMMMSEKASDVVLAATGAGRFRS